MDVTAIVDNAVPIAAFISCTALVFFLFRRRRKLKQEQRNERYLSTVREVTMTVEGRRLYVDKVFYEQMCDAVIDLVLDGKISDQEANDMMAWLGQKLRHGKDFEPIFRKKKPLLVKAKLKASDRRRKLNGGRKPTPAPIPEAPSNDGELSLSELFAKL